MEERTRPSTWARRIIGHSRKDVVSKQDENAETWTPKCWYREGSLGWSYGSLLPTYARRYARISIRVQCLSPIGGENTSTHQILQFQASLCHR